MARFNLRFGLAHRLVADARRRGHAIAERLAKIFLVVLIVRTIQEMSDDDASHMAAGVAYYALFSLFPLLLGLVALFSLFLNFSVDSETVTEKTVQDALIEFVTGFLPGSEEFVNSNLEALVDLRGALTVFAILGLFWSASTVFGAVSRAVNRAWDVHKDRPFYINKPRQLAMAMGVGLLFVLSLSAATFVRISGRLTEVDLPGLGFLINTGGSVLLQGSSFLLTLASFLILYKFMPNTKTYWRYIWPGAVLAAVLFELAKNLFIVYLNRFAGFENVYGSLAPVIVLLLWTYLSSLILITGAELSSEYGRLRMGIDRGILLHPREPSGKDEAEEKG